MARSLACVTGVTSRGAGPRASCSRASSFIASSFSDFSIALIGPVSDARFA